MSLSCKYVSRPISPLGGFPSIPRTTEGAADGESDAGPPNIVLILADDVGVEGFGCYGGDGYATPRIDALAREGMRFTDCYSQPLCTPSRVKLMTGRGNLRNYVHFSILDPAEKTFGDLAREAGYATGVFGKWQLLGAEHYGERAGTGTHPRDAGFDEWCLWQVETLGSRYADPTMDVNGELRRDVAGAYGPDLSCDALLEFATRERDRPFFAYYPMALVHDPFVATPGSPDGDRSRQQYFTDMVAHMDLLVGRIEDGLTEAGLRDDTVILFTSDNGTHPRIRSMRDGREVRGGKAGSTDRGIHVPLIASWPGRIPAGTERVDLIDFSDFYPTLAGLMQVEIPVDEFIELDGVSFLMPLFGLDGTPRELVTIYSNPRPPGTQRNPRVRFAFDRHWKLYDDGRMYDRAADPDEKRPLVLPALDAAAQAAHARLQAALDAMPEEPPHLRGAGD